MMSKKGFGEVASTLIMFIAIIGITLGLILSFQSFVVDTQGSFNEQQDLTSNKLKSSISITNTFYNSTEEKLYVYVKNIGRMSLDTTQFDVFVDEKFQNSFSTTEPTNFSKNISKLPIQETATVIINSSLNSGTHSVEIVTQYGVKDEESFNT